MKGVFTSDLPITTQVNLSQKYFKVPNYRKERDDTVCVQLWDTAGQERFLSLTRPFYRNSRGVVIVYDITSRLSFNAVQKWYDIVSQETDFVDVNIILIGNKSDLVSLKEVDTEEGISFASQHNLSFLETSALDGSNCNKALQILLQEIHKKQSEKRLTNTTPEIINQTASQVLITEEKSNDECGC